MTERERKRDRLHAEEEADIRQSTKRLEEDLEIMERHATDMDGVEEEIQDSMRRWDREHKNARLHSVPRHLKHVR